MNRKIILTKDVILLKGTVLDEISGATTQYSDDWFGANISLNKDNCAYIEINLDTLIEGDDYIIINE